MTTWEYQLIRVDVRGFITRDFDESALMSRLNAAGAAGWEVVSSFEVSAGSGQTVEVSFLLKRPHAS